MEVGMGLIFQNPKGTRTDAQLYADELRLADQAEGLGFDSIWTIEHHFTDYSLSPDPIQFLTYMAGRTERVKLGTMVIVLPWHDPVRVAESVSVLDIVSGSAFSNQHSLSYTHSKPARCNSTAAT
jgi:alkanesulfonate monooxygenase SsuD/methylene tetrahydromethanopterin reductase-like flavin-dependent oxidoreductase (luciferase family)